MTTPPDEHPAPAASTPEPEPPPSPGEASGAGAEAGVPSSALPIPADAQPRGAAFLLNVNTVPPPSEVELVPGHVVRRALPGEIQFIKQGISRLAAGMHPQVEYFWEYRWPHPDGPVETLPEEDWRYYVVAFEGTNETLTQLSQVFTLSEAEPIVGLTLISYPGFPGPAHFFNIVQLFHALERAMFGTDWVFLDLTMADIRHIQDLYQAIQTHDHSLIDVRRMTSELTNLNNMRHDSPLRFLGYFALLESLLTHAPKPTDPYDSITRQVKKKLALLNHRFTKPIDYSRFGGADPDKVWGKMYTYRSAVAHGGQADFARDIQLLKSPADALHLLRETTKAVARQALAEPQLLLDLRDC